jgi:hypothetical protein
MTGRFVKTFARSYAYWSNASCKYGYPPDKQEKATQTVLEPAALLSREWALA